MKNILHVTNIYFTLPYFIGDQFYYFKNRGYNLHVICSPSTYLKDYAFKMKFIFAEVEIVRAIKPLQDIKAIYVICKYIWTNQIEIVVGHTPKGALLAMISAWIMRVPKRIYFRHGLVYETSVGFKRRLLMNIDRITSFCATEIVCVSPSLSKRSLEDKLNIESKQCILGKGTCGGIDTKKKFNSIIINRFDIVELQKKLGISDDTIVLGYCGRLVVDKGIIDLVKAFDYIHNKYTDKKIVLLLVGMFEDRDALPIEIKDKIINDNNIIYTGYIHDLIENYYSLMNIFILPSFREGFGMSVLEASAMQIPVLTTRVTGCVDSIIENVTGMFVDNNSDSVASGIEYYINNPMIANQHGQNGREFVVKYFDQEIIWREIEKLYEN